MPSHESSPSLLQKALGIVGLSEEQRRLRKDRAPRRRSRLDHTLAVEQLELRQLLSGVPAEVASFDPSEQVSIGGMPNAVATGDINHDGREDIVALDAAGRKATVFASTPEGGMTSQAIPNIGAWGTAILADINGDTHLDLFTSGEKDPFQVFLGDGKGNFSPLPKQEVPEGLSSARFGYIDADGTLDMATTHETSYQALVWRGRGDGTFERINSFPTGGGTTDGILVDINGDGNLDHAAVNAWDNTLSVSLGDGKGGFGARKDYGMGKSPRGVASGDFNGDLHTDLVVSNGYSPEVTILLNKGDGTFTVTQQAVRSAFGRIITGQFTEDAYLDIAVAQVNIDPNTGEAKGNAGVEILAGRGDGTFANAGIITTGFGSYSLAQGDIDGNGTSDIVTADSRGGTVSIARNRMHPPAPSAEAVDLSAVDQVFADLSAEASAQAGLGAEVEPQPEPEPESPLTLSSPELHGATLSPDGTLSFDGSGYAVIPHTDNLSDFGNGPFTVGVTVQFGRSPGQTEMLLIKRDPATGRNFLLLRRDSGKMEGGVNDGEGNFLAVRMNRAITDTNAHNIVMTFDGEMLHFFVDGVEEATTIPEGTLKSYNVATEAPIVAGVYLHPDGSLPYPFVGSLRPPLLLNRTLTPEEAALSLEDLYLSLTPPASSASADDSGRQPSGEATREPEEYYLSSLAEPSLIEAESQEEWERIEETQVITGRRALCETAMGNFTVSSNTTLSYGEGTFSLTGLNGDYAGITFEEPASIGGIRLELPHHVWVVVKGITADGNTVLLHDALVTESGDLLLQIAEGVRVTELSFGPSVGASLTALLTADRKDIPVTGVEGLQQPWEALTEEEVDDAEGRTPELLQDIQNGRSIKISLNGMRLTEGDNGLGAALSTQAITRMRTAAALLVRLGQRNPQIFSDLKSSFADSMLESRIAGKSYTTEEIFMEFAKGNIAFFSTGNGMGVDLPPTQEGLSATLGSIILSTGGMEQARAYLLARGETQILALLDQGMGTDAVIANMNYTSYQVASAAWSGLNVSANLASESVEAPTSENTMIVVIYGSNQFPGDATAGFDNLLLNLKGDYSHILTATPGKNPFAKEDDAYLPNPSEALQLTKLRIKSTLEENPSIKYLTIIGYSWGGGTVYELASWINENRDLPRKIYIAATIYVDAVTNPAIDGGNYVNSFTAENRSPPGTQAMLNIYQSRTGLFSDGTLNGGPINNPNVADFQQFDLDAISDQYSHGSIDEASIWLILDFIQKRIRSSQ